MTDLRKDLWDRLRSAPADLVEVAPGGERALMEQATQAARLCSLEDGQARPKVAALLARGVEVLGAAYRGEMGPGEHAEFTLLEKKLAAMDLRGSTLFTTLEPCTTRNHPKQPCADRIAGRGIQRVIVGMLDPNPAIYEQGVARLRQADIAVSYFPNDLRAQLREMKTAFIEQFNASPDLSGSARFNFTHNNGRYTLGHGPFIFVTRWSNAASNAIHVYADGTGLRGLGLALSARTFEEVSDASAYDMSSRVRTPTEGMFIVLQNAAGHWAAIRVDDVKARSHGDPFDELTITYRINPDGSALF